VSGAGTPTAGRRSLSPTGCWPHWPAGRRKLRDRLASYKKPTALVLVDELPRRAAVKVLKHELRRKYGASQP
jgi:hypothetical protein